MTARDQDIAFLEAQQKIDEEWEEFMAAWMAQRAMQMPPPPVEEIPNGLESRPTETT